MYYLGMPPVHGKWTASGRPLYLLPSREKRLPRGCHFHPSSLRASGVSGSTYSVARKMQIANL